jgi:prefoldin subunit 5
VPEGVLSCDDPTQERMRQFLKTLEEAAVSGWKDPRTVLTFPMWKPLLGDYRIVACVRHPMSVAESLATREGWPIERGIDLWKAYHERFRQYLDDERDVLWFDFDLPPEQMTRSLGRACRSLGLRFEESALQSFNEFQRHHRHEALPPDARVRDLYLEFFYRAHREELNDGTRDSLGVIEAATRSRPSKAGLVREVESLHKRLASLGSSHQKQNSLAQRSFKATHESIRRVIALETAMGDVSRAGGELRGSVARLQEHLDGLDRREGELRGMVARLDERLAGVDRTERELQGTVARLDERFASVDRTEGELQGTVARLDERFAAVARAEDELREALARLDERLGGLDRADLQGTAARLDERVEALAQRLRECEDVLARKPQTLGQWLRQRLGFGSTASQ